MQSVGTFRLFSESALSHRLWARLTAMNRVDWNGAWFSEILSINACLLPQNFLYTSVTLRISNEAYQLPVQNLNFSDLI